MSYHSNYLTFLDELSKILSDLFEDNLRFMRSLFF